MPARFQLGLAGLLLSGCILPGVSSGPADAPDELRALGSNVVLLATPQREPENLLGAVVEPDVGPLLTRSMIVPATASSLGYLTYDGVREIGVSGGVAISGLDGDVDVAAITHVSYHVTISDTLYLAGEQAYDARSGCCLERGEVDASCEGGYVVRAFVGTGTFRYLARTEASAGFGAGGIETYGDAVFSVERERYFSHAVFAIEVAPAAPICDRAFCDERDGDGDCVRCRALGMQSELGMLAAPADDLLEVACGAMAPGADARVTVRGDVLSECAGGLTVSLGVTARGARSDHFELTTLDAMESPVGFARTLDGFTTSADGTLDASIDLLGCRCDDLPARCRLDRELELAVETVPR